MAGVVLVAAVIAFLSLAPPDQTEPDRMSLLAVIAELLLGDAGAEDKVGHFLAYAALGFLSLAAKPGRVLAVIVLSTVYGGVMEVLQLLVEGRSASFADLLADLLGACAGVLCLLAIKPLLTGALPWLNR
jgi:hypothetical protein